MGHEAEGGEDGLATTLGAGEGIGPEEAHRTVYHIVTLSNTTLGQIPGNRRHSITEIKSPKLLILLVDVSPVCVPQFRVPPPLLVVVHQIGQSLPGLGNLVLYQHQAERGDAAIVVAGGGQVGKAGLQ